MGKLIAFYITDDGNLVIDDKAPKVKVNITQVTKDEMPEARFVAFSIKAPAGKGLVKETVIYMPSAVVGPMADDIDTTGARAN